MLHGLRGAGMRPGVGTAASSAFTHTGSSRTQPDSCSCTRSGESCFQTCVRSFDSRIDHSVCARVHVPYACARAAVHGCVKARCAFALRVWKCEHARICASVIVCVSVCVCAYVRAHAHTHAHARMRAHERMHARTNARAHAQLSPVQVKPHYMTDAFTHAIPGMRDMIQWLGCREVTELPREADGTLVPFVVP